MTTQTELCVKPDLLQSLNKRKCTAMHPPWATACTGRLGAEAEAATAAWVKFAWGADPAGGAGAMGAEMVFTGGWAGGTWADIQ